MNTFSTRSHCIEFMDDPDCDSVRLLRTVEQFAAINRWVSRYRYILSHWVLVDMMKDPSRHYHLVDMGAGGCDIDAWLLGAARHMKLKLDITACDNDARIVSYARRVYGGVDGLAIELQDVMTFSPSRDVDYVFANHFLHHLNDAAVVQLLSHWLPRVTRRLVFSDLLRSRLAYLGYQWLSLFFPGGFARVDGLLSIRRGFTPLELGLLAGRVEGRHRIDVQSLLPGRLVLVIDP